MTAEAPNPGRNAIGVADALLRAALPGAEHFAFYDREHRCIWCSDRPAAGELEASIGAELQDSLARPGPVWSRLPCGRRVLVTAVTGDDGQLLGRLATVFAGGGDPAAQQAEVLEEACLSAASLIGQTLRLDRALAGERIRAEEAEQELKLVYRVDQKIHGTSRSHASLAQLVGQSGRFLGIAYSVLLLPAKRIRISATHSTWKNVNRKVLDKYLINTLFPRMQDQRAPVVFEVPSVPGSDDISDLGYQAMVCPLLDGAGKVEGILAQLGRVGGKPFRPSHQRFMAHIARKVEYVIEQSFDSMTGLTNRAGFEAQLAEASKSLAGDEESHQIIYIDLDNLQLVNTTFGQEAGDAVITRFAQILEQQVPPNAVAGRLTGDDFAVLLTHSSIDAALELAAAVREDSDSLRYLQGDRSLQVTVSIGIAAFDSSGDESAVLTAARIACDSAKDHGRDRVEVYDQDNQSIVRRFDNMNLVAEIQKMLDADGFELLAQPIAPLMKKGAVNRFEILLRMRDSDGDEISSASFFSAAERYQMMPQIDRWVVSMTLGILGEHAAAIQRAGTLFAINLSGQSLGDDEFLSFIHQRIDASGLPPQSLCFEVTESAAVSNHAKAQAFIDALRQRGCKFSLDDFGAGLSSFAYLKNFNVDTLKIDGHFIKDISGNRISESMVAAITQVAKVMGLDTVAEYVETEGIREYVAGMGVDYAQGHAIGRPAPLTDVLCRLGMRERLGAVRERSDS